VEKDRPLAQFTTIGIGGPARFFVEADNQDAVVEGIRWADAKGLPVFILGGGSNILISDAGFDGLVLKIVLRGISFKQDLDGTTIVTAAAGEDWDRLVSECVVRGLTGIESLSGIPGTVGGTPIQNVGAYGQEVSQTIVSVRCIDRATLGVVEFSNDECDFAYRKSIFNTTAKGKYVVLFVSFRLSGGEPQMPEYPELRREIETLTKDGEITPTAIRNAVLKIRRRKSMVIEPSDPNSKSLGSFFKNPVVTREVFESLREVCGDVPSFTAEFGVKIPAAWLIENAGFHKGYNVGRVGISANHSLALINRGGATGSEILAFRDVIADAVEQNFGIRLQMEPEIVGN
jgi:UDP-N-acetylmuramate dehydrogenase